MGKSVGQLLALLMSSRVIARSLPRKQNTKNNRRCDDQGGADAAEIESARRNGFGEKVTQRSAKRAGEDERRPEQQRTRDLRIKIGDREKH